MYSTYEFYKSMISDFPETFRDKFKVIEVCFTIYNCLVSKSESSKDLDIIREIKLKLFNNNTTMMQI